MNKMPVFGITGWKNAGKTTLIMRLITEFSRRGLDVAAVKHAHQHFKIDHPGRDSYAMRKAGATQVAIVSPQRWALITELDGAPEPGLDEMLALMRPADLVLVEGFKSDPHPKIEVRRGSDLTWPPLSAHDHNIVGIASDVPTENGGLPLFSIDDIATIADFITSYLGLFRRNHRPIPSHDTPTT